MTASDVAHKAVLNPGGTLSRVRKQSTVHTREDTRSALCTGSRAPNRTTWIRLCSFLSRPNEKEISYGQLVSCSSSGFHFSKIWSVNRRRQIALSNSKNAVSFSSACTTNRFPSPRCASATKIVRPSRSTVATQPQLQPALLRLSAMISQSCS